MRFYQSLYKQQSFHDNVGAMARAVLADPEAKNVADTFEAWRTYLVSREASESELRALIQAWRECKGAS